MSEDDKTTPPTVRLGLYWGRIDRTGRRSSMVTQIPWDGTEGRYLQIERYSWWQRVLKAIGLRPQPLRAEVWLFPRHEGGQG